MNKTFCVMLIGLIGVIEAKAAIAEEEILLQWQGRSALTELAHLAPRPGQILPEELPGTLGLYKELRFKVASEDARRGRQYIDLLLPRDAVLERFTAACYVRPERRRFREEFLNALGPGGRTGFSLRHHWGVVTFEFGDGELTAATKVRFQGRSDAFLDRDSWQHLAVVFDQGKVSIYKNGILIETAESKLAHIRLAHSGAARVGAHRWVDSRDESAEAAYPFEGRMTGIFLSGQALNTEEIFELMEKMIRPASQR